MKAASQRGHNRSRRPPNVVQITNGRISGQSAHLNGMSRLDRILRLLREDIDRLLELFALPSGRLQSEPATARCPDIIPVEVRVEPDQRPKMNAINTSGLVPPFARYSLDFHAAVTSPSARARTTWIHRPSAESGWARASSLRSLWSACLEARTQLHPHPSPSVIG